MNQPDRYLRIHADGTREWVDAAACPVPAGGRVIYGTFKVFADGWQYVPPEKS